MTTTHFKIKYCPDCDARTDHDLIALPAGEGMANLKCCRCGRIVAVPEAEIPVPPVTITVVR